MWNAKKSYKNKTVKELYLDLFDHWRNDLKETSPNPTINKIRVLIEELSEMVDYYKMALGSINIQELKKEDNNGTPTSTQEKGKRGE